MKNSIQILILCMLVGVVFSCKKNKPAGDAAKTSDAVGKAATSSATSKTYTIDTKSSGVSFTGTKLGGQHLGKFALTDGTLSVKGGDIESGNFTIDIASLEITDLKAGEGKEKLEGHLKSADFFDVANHSTGKFVITNVAKTTKAGMTHTITGDLELKGKKKSITFDANVAEIAGSVNAVTPNFTINRADWEIKYGSNTFFDNLGDKAINDEVGIRINLKANAK